MCLFHHFVCLYNLLISDYQIQKAVLSILADICGDSLPQKVEKRRKRITTISISDIVMKQCRTVLRRAAAADDAKVFCNLLGRKLMASCDNDDEGLLGPPGMVSRPLDFRTIDLRLAAGSYDGSHEAFLEDVQEVCFCSLIKICYNFVLLYVFAYISSYLTECIDDDVCVRVLIGDIFGVVRKNKAIMVIS